MKKASPAVTVVAGIVPAAAGQGQAAGPHIDRFRGVTKDVSVYVR